MENDSRTRYTEDAIRAVFVLLLKEKPLEKITVKEICETAMINRTTFYRHYQDCYDLAQRMKEDALNSFIEMLRNMEAGSAETVIVRILEKLRDGAELFQTPGRSEESRTFMNSLTDACFMYMNNDAPVWKMKNLNETDRRMVSSYLTAGAASLIEDWLKSGCIQPAEKIASMMISLSNSLLRNLPESV